MIKMKLFIVDLLVGLKNEISLVLLVSLRIISKSSKSSSFENFMILKLG